MKNDKALNYLYKIMGAKAARILRSTKPFLAEAYWNYQKDKHLFDTFSSEQLTRIAKRIAEEVVIQRGLSDWEVCPFCAALDLNIFECGCNGCPYGEVKGICDERVSIYSLIRKMLGPNAIVDDKKLVKKLEVLSKNYLKEVNKCQS